MIEDLYRLRRVLLGAVEEIEKPFRKPMSVIRLDASQEMKGVEVARDVDFIFLKYVPPGVSVYVSMDNSEYIDLTYLRAVYNPTSRWKTVRITTRGTASDFIEIYLGGEAAAASYITSVPNIDVPLSSRASEATLSGIKSQTDKLLFDTYSNLKVNAVVVANPPNLDVALSSRASEATLSKIANALASIATDKLRVSPVDPFPLSPVNVSQISGTALTGRDWSGDFAKLQNLDVLLSSRASEATLSKIANALNSVGTDQILARIASTAIIVPIDIQSHYKALITLLSGSLTASGNTADIDVSRYERAEGSIAVTAVSGTTPSLDIYIEGKREWSGTYKPLIYQTGITSTGEWDWTIDPLRYRYLRVRYVVSGTTPSFTVVVGGIFVA